LREAQCVVDEVNNMLEGTGNPMTVVEEHSVLAEAIPRGVVDDTEERMPV
jgi:hypothetical protein